MVQRKTAALFMAVLLPASGLILAYAYFWGLGGQQSSGTQIYGTSGPCYNVTVVISYGKAYANQTLAGLDFPNGTTAFDAIDDIANVTCRYYGSLVFVEGINGVFNNATANSFWQYYVNGEFGPVASNVYHLGNSSVVEWRYEQSRF